MEVDVNSTPSPGQHDKLTQMTTSGTDLDMDLDKRNLGSSIATLEPYSSPIRNKNVSMRKPLRRTETLNKIQILPGLYELVSYNKFLILRIDSEEHVKINVFKGNREIAQHCGSEPKILPQGDGSLLIEASSPEQSEALLKMTKLTGIKVQCYPHPTFNQCRGVIYAPELLELDCEEIQSELADQGVVRVVRMQKKINGTRIPLATLILTFNKFKLPNIIKAGWLNLKVKPYIPTPMRCFHCQKYGHLIQKCKKMINREPAVCITCGMNAHGTCTNPPSCIHCGEGHSSSSKNCVKFIFEKEVQTIRVMEKLSFKEARKRALERYIRPGESFSALLKSLKPDNPQPKQQKLEETKSDVDGSTLISTGTVPKITSSNKDNPHKEIPITASDGATGKKPREKEDSEEDLKCPTKKQKSSKSPIKEPDIGTVTHNRFAILENSDSVDNVNVLQSSVKSNSADDEAVHIRKSKVPVSLNITNNENTNTHHQQKKIILKKSKANKPDATNSGTTKKNR